MEMGNEGKTGIIVLFDHDSFLEQYLPRHYHQPKIDCKVRLVEKTEVTSETIKELETRLNCLYFAIFVYFPLQLKRRRP